MSASTKIEWTDSTFNPWIGCTEVSTEESGGGGCDHCYARELAKRYGWAEWGAGKPRVRTSAANWRKPAQWNKAAFWECAACRWRGAQDYLMTLQVYPERGLLCPNCGKLCRETRRRVFCASLADVFDNEVDEKWRIDLLQLILATPNLDWLLLTKRVGNVRTMLPGWFRDNWPSHVWIGATMVNRDEVLRDARKLKEIPASVRFWSIEPMLGDLGKIPRELMPDWVIAGGESGPKARPMHPDWIRSLRDQCAAADVPFLFKQHGEWIGVDDIDLLPLMEPKLADPRDYFAEKRWQEPAPMGELAYRVGKKLSGRLLDGRAHDGFPSAAVSKPCDKPRTTDATGSAL